MNIFERAIKERTRVKSAYGNISAEDLYHGMSLQQLDSIYKDLSAELSKEDSLLATNTSDDKINHQIDLVKVIVKSRLEVVEVRKEKQKIANRQKKLITLLETKEEEDFFDKYKKLPAEEIRKLIYEMGEEANVNINEKT